MKRESSILLGGWLVLAVGVFVLGWQNLSTPGLHDGEAIHGGLAADFLNGHAGPHTPGVMTAHVWGRPFPIFVQLGLGALKSWLLIPGFKLFGSTLAVLRTANLALAVTALLLFMAWTWRLLGLMEALLAGVLLASDPGFFFAAGLDWDSLLPSLLCRFGGFLLALQAWRRQHAGWALAAGLAFGLGVFNHLDFGVILAGTTLAAMGAFGRALTTTFRLRPKILLAGLLGLLAGAAPIWWLLGSVPATIPSPGALAQKWQVFRMLFDGSYFYRFLDAGGQFDHLYQASPPVWTPFGIGVLIAAVALAADTLVSPPESSLRRSRVFILLSAGWITLGALMLPGPLRMDQAMLVYPFPHLIIAAAAVAVWRRAKRLRRKNFQPVVHELVAGILTVLLVCNWVALQRTRHFIAETGGRGWWSDALERFAAELPPRPGLTVVTLDGGFAEVLEFIAPGLLLEEPFWQHADAKPAPLPREARHLYLLHPTEFSHSPLGGPFLESARTNANAVVTPWHDRQGRVAFYSVTFTGP